MSDFYVLEMKLDRPKKGGLRLFVPDADEVLHTYISQECDCDGCFLMLVQEAFEFATSCRPISDQPAQVAWVVRVNGVPFWLPDTEISEDGYTVYSDFSGAVAH